MFKRKNHLSVGYNCQFDFTILESLDKSMELDYNHRDSTDVFRFQRICAKIFLFFVFRGAYDDFWSFLSLDFISSLRSLFFLPII